MISRLIARCLVCVAFFAGSELAGAAACYQGPQALSEETVNAFLGAPGEMLTKFPEGESELTSQIRDLAASDSATLPSIIDLIKVANRRQQAAIGSGLGMAARMCVCLDQAYGNQIQQAVAGAHSKQVSLAYSSVTLTRIASAEMACGAPGGGGGGGRGGGVGGALTNSGAPAGGRAGGGAAQGDAATTVVTIPGHNFLTGGTAAAGVVLSGGGDPAGNPKSVSAH
jgi:hypothetical protein